MVDSLVLTSIADQIVHQVKNDIFSGKLKAGESLREVPMAEKYNVSRGPVRDAFKVLAKEGFLISRPNVGVEVAPPPKEEVLSEVIQLRRQLERFALERTLGSFEKEDFLEMEQALVKMEEACDMGKSDRILKYDVEFHSVIVQKYNDRHLFGIWNELVFRMMFNYSRFDHLRESCSEHAAILSAIKEKDKIRAVELLEANIQ